MRQYMTRLRVISVVVVVGFVMLLLTVPAMATQTNDQLAAESAGGIAGQIAQTTKYTVELSPAEEKALLWDMMTIEDWLSNAIHNKARRTIDDIVVLALSDTSGTILTVADKGQIADALSAKGILVVGSVNQIPRATKELIVSLAQIASAAERQAEFEAEFP